MQFDLQLINAGLAKAPTDEVLRWAVRTFPDDIAMSSSFQTQSVPLLHMVAITVPQLPVLFLDTGYHFPETIAFRDHLVRIWDLNLVVLKGDAGPAEGLDSSGSPLYLTNPDMCCNLRKVVPMRQAVVAYRGWISGIRRDQAQSRANAQVVEAVAERRCRIHPMLDWTHDDVNHYIAAHELPEHPLSAIGYASIGCAPCTRPPLPGGDLRSGRWVGSGKTECGLHTILRKPSEETEK